jgi:GH15 family glucan-1,4-alpha-glucosidase
MVGAKASQRPSRTGGYLPIEEYAAIGDGHVIALVGSDGAIDWMCLPRFDSPSVFGALLDHADGGEFVISPASRFGVMRRYIERTNILETTFDTDGGRVQLRDALLFDSGQRALVRQVHGLSGTVSIRWRFRPRFGFEGRAPDLAPRGPAIVARDRQLQMGLLMWDAGAPKIADSSVSGQFEVSEGETAILAMVATDGLTLRLPDRERVEHAIEETARRWRSWIARHHYEGPWTEALERSLLAIGLLTNRREGAIAAAGTTSLPEVLGGKRNYDYRFAWVRDLCFTVDALLAVGMDELSQATVDWLLRATGHTHPRIDPVYGLDAQVVRSGEALALPGYRGTAPVHVGNDAGSQLQLGGFGDVLETMAIYAAHGHVLAPEVGQRLADIGDLLAVIWRREDCGLWELPDRAHYGTSKLGCWLAFDRLLGLCERRDVPARHVERWRGERDRVRAFIERDLISEERHSYSMKPGSDALDCGMLLAARRGFGGTDRLLGTIDAILGELHAGGPLLYRYSGMQDDENAFVACSFWMVEALASAGRVEQAVELMDGVVALSNDVGLYSEEIEPGTHAMRGNFPQALTHLALINAADTVARRGRDALS